MSDRVIHGNLALVTGPTIDPLTLQDAKDHLRVVVDHENAYIESLIQAAQQHVDGRDGWLGRALLTQTWDYSLPAFPIGRCLRLPLPPVQSIASIKYRDAAGSLLTFDSANYTLSADRHWRPEVQLAPGASWPGTHDQPDAVVIQTVHGYGATAESVPMAIRQALLLLIGHWFENRESVNIGNIVSEIPSSAEALLAPYVMTAF